MHTKKTRGLLYLHFQHLFHSWICSDVCLFKHYPFSHGSIGPTRATSSMCIVDYGEIDFFMYHSE